MATDGTNLTIKYSDNGSVILSNYYYNKKYNINNSVKTLETANGETTDLSTFLDDKTIAITGAGYIEGTDDNNLILGSTWNDYIVAKGGNDTIYAGDGNDTVIGGTGENTIVFEGENFGNDTVYLTANERLILDLSAYENLNDSNIKYSFSGTSLIIDTQGHGTITLADFAAQDVTGKKQPIT